MSNILFRFVSKCNETILMVYIFISFSIFKLCFSSEHKWARFYFNYFIYLSAWFAGCIVYYPLLLFKGRNLQNVKELAGIYEYLGQRVLGIQLTVRNSKVLLEDKPAVIVVNHQSSLEILLIFQIWRKFIRRIIGVSKSELLYLFPYGQTNYLLGTMFVNRKKGGLLDMERIGREVVREKARAFMMPEGTRNHNKETLLPFKRGAFHMAIKSQIPIIPIAISPFYFIDYEKPSFGQPRIIMKVLDEVPTVGMTIDDVSELREKVRLQIWDAYKELYHECMIYKTQDNGEYNSNGYLIIE